MPRDLGFERGYDSFFAGGTVKSILRDFGGETYRPVLRPEERLLLAVVEAAYWDLQCGDPLRRDTAWRYFLDDRSEHAFSFLSICDHFHWSPVSIRSSLRRSAGLTEWPADLSRIPATSMAPTLAE